MKRSIGRYGLSLSLARAGGCDVLSGAAASSSMLSADSVSGSPDAASRASVTRVARCWRPSLAAAAGRRGKWAGGINFILASVVLSGNGKFTFSHKAPTPHDSRPSTCSVCARCTGSYCEPAQPASVPPHEKGNPTKKDTGKLGHSDFLASKTPSIWASSARRRYSRAPSGRAAR